MVAMGAKAGSAARAGHSMLTCEHLAPLARALREAGMPLERGYACPHDREWGWWFNTSVRFGARSLRRRLHLERCVIYEEYEGVFGPSDAMFYCTCCKQAIVGLHPKLAEPTAAYLA